jgi:hypothetical protein
MGHPPTRRKRSSRRRIRQKRSIGHLQPARAGGVGPSELARPPQPRPTFVTLLAASILTAVYHMLKNGTMYKDLGRDHFDRRSTDQQKHRLVKRLADLGYAVHIKPLAA